MTLNPASSAIYVTGREGSACAFAPGLLTAYWQYNETVNSINDRYKKPKNDQWWRFAKQCICS